MYLVVHKQELVIFVDCVIPIPMSHFMETKLEALQWMSQRGMQKDCKVMHKEHFKARGGWTG